MQVSAFAKINLSLEILGRREDGYHEIRTVLQTIDLADQLYIEPAPTLRVKCDAPNLDGDANLVWLAAMTLARSQNIQPQASITLRKGIPEGMGLGGGSSDAAATLLALNQLWELNLSREALAELAGELGSDVPFFLWGGTALAVGRGELVTPLPPIAAVPVTLICPHATLLGKTARLYSMITPAQYSDGGITHRMMQSLMEGSFVVDSVHNSFEAVAPLAFPELEPVYRQVAQVAETTPHLAGSGPALFCLPSSKEEYGRLVEALQPYGVEAYLVHTIPAEATNV